MIVLDDAVAIDFEFLGLNPLDPPVERLGNQASYVIFKFLSGFLKLHVKHFGRGGGKECQLSEAETFVNLRNSLTVETK